MLGLSESYVRVVLGFESYSLNESKYSITLSEEILREHQLFESWWSPVGEILGKAKDKIKKKALEPIEALKEFGQNTKGIIAALTAAVKDSNSLEKARNYVDRNIKTIFTVSIVKKLQRIAKALTRLNMPTFAEGVLKMAKGLGTIRQKLYDMSGWKGLLSVLAFVLGIRYIDDKLKITDSLGKVYDMLSNPKDYFKGEVLEFILGSDDEEEDGENEGDDSVMGEMKEKIIEFLKEKFTEELAIVDKMKEQVLDFGKKLAGKAIESFAGPLAWVKQAGELFGSASWVAAQIGPILSDAIQTTTESRLRRQVRSLILERLKFNKLHNMGMYKFEHQGFTQFVLFDTDWAYQVIKAFEDDPDMTPFFLGEHPKYNGGLKGIVVLSEPEQPSGGAWRVRGAAAQDGWGPTMYDIVMGATSRPLMADRGSVSRDAKGVWDFYKDKRDDIEKNPLDDYRKQYTPDPDDDARPGGAGAYLDRSYWSGGTHEDFLEDSLNWTYNREKVPGTDQLYDNAKYVISMLEFESIIANDTWWNEVMMGFMDYRMSQGDRQ